MLRLFVDFVDENLGEKSTSFYFYKFAISIAVAPFAFLTRHLSLHTWGGILSLSVALALGAFIWIMLFRRERVVDRRIARTGSPLARRKVY